MPKKYIRKVALYIRKYINKIALKCLDSNRSAVEAFIYCLFKRTKTPPNRFLQINLAIIKKKLLYTSH